MADRYISRDMAIARLTKVEVTEKLATMADAKRAIADMPAADVAPVVHGRWEKRGSAWYCTRCGIGYRITYGNIPASRHKYCPRCGVRMDGKDGDGNETPDV